MRVSKKLLKIFKEFYLIPKNATHALKDLSYRKTIILEENLDKDDFKNSMVSWERIRADRVLFVLDLLSYKITAHKLGFGTESLLTFHWLVKTQKALLGYLNNLDEKKSFYTPNYLYKHVTYSKAKLDHELLKFSDVAAQKMVGRLYSSKSIYCISREIRYLLFSGEYVDFDIKNCHPTICLNYGEIRGLAFTGSLRNYVENRKETLKKIDEELAEYYLKNPSAKFKWEETPTKERILIIQNKTWDKYDTGSETLNKLDDEFTIVKEHLWHRYLNNEFVEYASKVEIKESLQEKMSTLQSLVFQSKETEHLFALKTFLTEKYSFYIENKKGVKGLKDYIIDSDKDINLSAAHGLLMIPFFDGFYIKALDERFMSSLNEYVEMFNKDYTKKHYITFERKEIAPVNEYLKNCSKKDKNFLHVTDFLRKKNRIGFIKKYMEKLPEVDKCLSKIEGLDISDVLYSEKVKQINDEIKTHFIHSLLTSGEEFDSVESVKAYVSCVLSKKNSNLKDTVPIELKYSQYDSDVSIDD